MNLTKKLKTVFLVGAIGISAQANAELKIEVDLKLEIKQEELRLKRENFQSRYNQIENKTFQNWNRLEDSMLGPLYENNFDKLKLFHKQNKNKNVYSTFDYGGIRVDLKPTYSNICMMTTNMPKTTQAHPFTGLQRHKNQKIDFSLNTTNIKIDQKKHYLILLGDLGVNGAIPVFRLEFDNENKKYLNSLKNDLKTAISFCQENKELVNLFRKGNER